MRLRDLESLDFVTVIEAAELLRVSKMTVYRLIERGDLKCTMIGGCYRIPAPDLVAYLAR